VRPQLAASPREPRPPPAAGESVVGRHGQALRRRWPTTAIRSTCSWAPTPRVPPMARAWRRSSRVVRGLADRDPVTKRSTAGRSNCY